jgi:cytochrome P450
MHRKLLCVAFFNPFRPGYADDPYPALARLRADEPVHWSAELGGWVLTRYDDCLRAIQDDDYFSSDPAHAIGKMGDDIRARRGAVPLGTAPILGNSDPPDHTRLRSLVNRAFTPAVMEGMRPTVESAVDHLMGGAHEGTPWDAVLGLCEPLAATTILAHLGIPQEGWNAFRQWSIALMMTRSEKGMEPAVMRNAELARGAMLAYIASVAERRDVAEEAMSPKDVLGALLGAVESGQITADEMLMTLIHISMAGNGPLMMAMSNIIANLASNPEVRRQLMDDPDLMPAAVEELLRWDSSTHYVARWARDDVSMGKRTIRKGQMAYAMISAANRDPEKFPDPDRIDLNRGVNRHLSFGMGIHYCLGTPLARIQLEVVTRRIIERWGAYEVVRADRGGNLQVRGFSKLEILPHAPR